MNDIESTQHLHRLEVFKTGDVKLYLNALTFLQAHARLYTIVKETIKSERCGVVYSIEYIVNE